MAFLRRGFPREYTAAASVSMQGLTASEARPGDHASITALMSDASTILTHAWGSTLDGTEYGTGTSPSDYTAGDGGTLYLTVTTAAGTYRTTAPIRYAAPVAAGGLVDQSFPNNSGNQTYDVSGDFTFSGTEQWSFVSAPAGVTIDGAGVITFDTNTLSEQAGTSIVVRLEDSNDSSRFADSGFSLDIVGSASITIDSVTFVPGSGGNPDQVTIDFTSAGTSPPFTAYAAFGDGTLAVDAAQLKAQSGGTGVDEFTTWTVDTDPDTDTLTLTVAADGATNLAVLLSDGSVDSNIATDTFAALDLTAPTLVPASCVPADGATGAGTTGDLTAVFNENVFAGSGNFYLYDTAGPTLIDTVPIGSCTITSADVDIPFANRANSTNYSVRWDAGVVKDAKGNDVAANTGDTLWNFGTAAGGASPTIALVDDNAAVTFSGGSRPSLDTQSLSVSDELLVVVTKEGGGQTDAITDADFGGVALGTPDYETSATVSRSKVYMWRVAAVAGMIGATTTFEVTGAGSVFRVAIFKISGTITTETVASNQYTDTTDPLVGSVNTGDGAIVSAAVKEDISLGTSPFTWVGATFSVGETSANDERHEIATSTTTPATPRTVTAEHGSAASNDHAAILTYAVS